MADIAVKIAWALLTKLATETFVAKLLVYSLRSVADATGKKKLAEEMVDAIAEALGVKEDRAA